MAIEPGGGDDGIAEHVAPFGKAAIGGQDQGTAFVAGADELEKQIATARDDREAADLVDDQQRGACREPDALVYTPFAFGAGKLADEIGQGAKVDACLHRPLGPDRSTRDGDA